jgi:hypothetical protein
LISARKHCDLSQKNSAHELYDFFEHILTNVQTVQYLKSLMSKQIAYCISETDL